MTKYLFMTIILSVFLLGFAIGTGVGMQKGQYMLFEGLDGIFDGAEINIDINETEMINGITDFYKPYFEEMFNDSQDDALGRVSE